MSTSSKVNFEPASSLIGLYVKDVVVADVTTLDPSSSTCLVEGEWATLDSNGKLIRAAFGTVGGTATTDYSTAKSFPLWSERGRTDVRSLSTPKCPIIYCGSGEWETRVVATTQVTTSNGGAALTAIMQPLVVAAINLDLGNGQGTRKYSGLMGGTIGTSQGIVGYCTRLPTTANGSRMRFILGGRV